MTQNITTYYIPQNLNITVGKIYNIYLNKVTNLDLTSIIEKKEITLNGILQPNKEILTPPQSTTTSTTISIEQEDYDNIMKLAETSTQLYNQSQALVKKLTKGSDKSE